MQLTDLTLDMVKDFLHVDHDLDDNKIAMHIETAKNYIAVSHGYERVDMLGDNEYLTDMAMLIIQDLYDNGTITNVEPISFFTIDRRF